MTTPPNILFIMTDEQRAPTPYESPELTAYRNSHLPAQRGIMAGGISFERHYAASMACAPGRTSLYTGHYPSLHGVSQTDGAATGAFDSGMLWLEPSSVPTMGHYFRAAGYRTYWRGKWHASEEDILTPGSRNRVNSYDDTGARRPEIERIYQLENPLGGFGFDGWVGPEPHGAAPLNSGSSAGGGKRGRDLAYAEQVIELIDVLDGATTDTPWFITASFINPHDIVLWGLASRLANALQGTYNFAIDEDVPQTLFLDTFAESHNEDLVGTKPTAQESYRKSYRNFMQPSAATRDYYRLYYQLHHNSDREISKVITRLNASRFASNTIIVFTSDHGDLLGSHGGLFQKWYNAYEEALRVPFAIYAPHLLPTPGRLNLPTSHVDVLPTLLGLAGFNAESIRQTIAADFTNALPLVGRNLAPLLRGEVNEGDLRTPVYFMTDDDPSRGQNQANLIGIDTASVVEPSSLETVIADIDGTLWKYSRYYDNPQFWSDPGVPGTRGVKDVIDLNQTPIGNRETSQDVTYRRTIKVTPAPDEFEMYNLNADPLELDNLAGKNNPMEATLAALLYDQCAAKRLKPISGTVPGQPSCGPTPGPF